jgi:hypothetical protein
MSVSKLTDRTELNATPDTADLLHVVDIDDTTGSAEGTSKKITVQNLLAAAASSGSSTVTVRNGTGATITKGLALHIDGITGSTPTVELADQSAISTMPAVGLAAEDILNGADGGMIILGVLENVDTSSFSVSDSLYVGSSGVLTNTPPTGTALIQTIAICLKASAANGSLLVEGAGRTNQVPNLPNREVFIGDATGTTETRAMGSTDLDDMSPGGSPAAGHIFQHDGVGEFRGIARVLSGNTDVATSTPSNGDTLTYNSATSLWEPAAGGGGGSNFFTKNFAFFDNNVRDVYVPWTSEVETISVQRYNRYIIPVDCAIKSITIWFSTSLSGGTGGSVDLLLSTGAASVTTKTSVAFSSTTGNQAQTFTFTTNNTYNQGDVMMVEMKNGFGAIFNNIVGTVLFEA